MKLTKPRCALFSPSRINLYVQTLYQIVVLLILQFKAEPIFSTTAKVKSAMILTTFVLCQVFNYTNGSKPEKLKGKQRLVIVTFTIALQVVMVEFLKKFADAEMLNLKQWRACLAIAAMSWPIGWSIKYLLGIEELLQKLSINWCELPFRICVLQCPNCASDLVRCSAHCKIRVEDLCKESCELEMM